MKDRILRHLSRLVGQRLAVTRRVADMRSFDFGAVTVDPSGRDQWELALHVQCPWRIDGPQGIVTGRSDLWDPAEAGEAIDRDTWDYDAHPNLQDRRMGELFGTVAPGSRSYVRVDGRFVVEGVDADEYGGAVVSLSGGYRIVIFPAGAAGEDWRLLGRSLPRHLVVAGGRVQRSPDDAD